MKWMLLHLQHLLGYPAVAFAARWIGQYELTRLKKEKIMNVPVISQLVCLIEEILKSHGPAVAKAVEQAAAGAAVETVEQDPKVQAVTEASVAFLAAAQSLKTALAAQPAEPAAAPEAEQPAPPAA